MEAFFELIPSHDEEPMEEFPTPRRLSRLPAKSKYISSSSSYAKKLQSAFMTDQPPKPAPSETRRPAWNRLPVNIQYENSTNEDFPPLPAKTNSDETRSTASSTASPSTTTPSRRPSQNPSLNGKPTPENSKMRSALPTKTYKHPSKP
jgi:hypothetical protein